MTMDGKANSETEWQDVLCALPSFEVPAGPVVFVAPHPDDETLAAGGLLAALAESGTPITVVAVTDGDAAYDPAGDPALARVRRSEQVAALEHLGIGEDRVVRLGFPDRCIPDYEAELSHHLVDLLMLCGPDVSLIAPWRGDFHCDHEASGRSAEIAAKRMQIRLIRWLWWSWHRRDLALVTALPLARFSLEPRWRAQKLSALSEHRSQLGEDAILPKSLLFPAHRNFEVYA